MSSAQAPAPKGPTKAANARVELVCVGRARVEGDRLAYEWREVLPDGSLSDVPRLYSRIRSATPGGVYSVEIQSLDAFRSDKGSIYPTTLRWERAWSDRAQAAQWQAAAEAVETVLAAEKGYRRHPYGNLRQGYRSGCPAVARSKWYVPLGITCAWASQSGRGVGHEIQPVDAHSRAAPLRRPKLSSRHGGRA